MRDDDENHPRRRESPPRAGSLPAFSTMDECVAFFRRAQTEPEAFTLYMVRAQADRQHAILERLLLGSAAQTDRVLASQLASSHALHEALQTLARGANDIAVAGAGFFRGSLEATARAAGMRHATELGKQRARLVRDAVATSSGMVQEVLAPRAAPPAPHGAAGRLGFRRSALPRNGCPAPPCARSAILPTDPVALPRTACSATASLDGEAESALG